MARLAIAFGLAKNGELVKTLGPKSVITGALGAIGLALFLSAAAAPPRQQSTATPATETVLTLDANQSKVHWTVDTTLHTVHGTFNLRDGTLHFDPQTGKAGGEIVVLASSGESGNDSRDARMHKEILETAKFPDAVFRPTLIEGVVAPSGPSDIKLHGIFSIHGADHDLVVPVHADLNDGHWKGTGKFHVPYTDWGIKDPSNFFLKVKHVVVVELDFSGETKPPKPHPSLQ